MPNTPYFVKNLKVKVGRLTYEYPTATIFDAADPENPLHGSLRNLGPTSVVIVSGKQMQVANLDCLVFG